MSETSIDWATAEVAGGKLKVRLTGDLPPGFKEHFAAVERILKGREWGPVKLKKKRIRVGGITPGAEERLRHHLESIVQQASAIALADQPAAARSAPAGREDGPDRIMERRFRAFAAA